MKIGVKKVVEVDLRKVHVYAKVCDSASYDYIDSQGDIIKSFDGDYVPSFFPGDHHGDYLDLEIDIETGQIINWKKPTPEQLKTLLAPKEDDE